ncbi:hypothetical protein CQW23_33582 [Capsicum baccatum]|uniref:LRR receptor-like serine/threonine-protein kinase n=1 Tax=Capsicum baccatum TaxID=33114 RepID=A0A2G2V1G6_CAPBA|nr:hypothetical protein CQW23_33582 [Capsicum baccatum]
MFHELRILDFSCNDFMGNLPTSLFQHFRTMRKIDPSKKAPSDDEVRYYQNSIAVVTKGIELEVVRILFLYTTIDLSNNKFEGHVPSIIVDLIALRVLNLSHNGLQGEIPAQFASLTFLAFLNLSYNHLEGCIPQGPQFHTFENNSYEGNDGLRGFPLSEGCGNDGHDSVSEETYAGSVLDEESNSEFLNDFWKGTLMGENLSSTMTFGCSNQKVFGQRMLLRRGTIPSQIGSLVKFQIIRIFDNYLNGSIAEEIGYLRSLTKLSLGWNFLNGSIPPSLGKLTNLTLLNLYENQLSGSVLEEIGYLRSLTELDLSTNFLNEIGKLANLVEAYLEKKTINRSHPSNELFGPIPAEIGKMRSLQNLSLFSNNISDPIPKTIGDLTKVKLLDLYATQLSSPIPSELGKLKNLNGLELSNNQLTG